MRTIKTYGTTRFREWSVIVNIGAQQKRINFRDGAMSGESIVPATYTTDSPIVQYAIENSPFFRNGFVKVIKTLDTEDSRDMVEARRRAAAAEAAKAKRNVKTAPAPDGPAAEDGGEDTDGGTKEEGEDADGGEEADVTDGAPAGVSGEKTAEGEGGKTEVPVTCQNDAVEYLKAHYEGYTSSKLRTKAAIERAAEDHGIIFVGL